MANFDHMIFGYNDGDFNHLVFHAKKYSKEEALEVFKKEYGNLGLECTIEDITSAHVKYFIQPTEQISRDFIGGCYSYTDGPENGSFPVWVIDVDYLKEKNS